MTNDIVGEEAMPDDRFSDYKPTNIDKHISFQGVTHFETIKKMKIYYKQYTTHEPILLSLL